MKSNRKKFEGMVSSPKNDFFDELDKLIKSADVRTTNAEMALILLDYMQNNSLNQKQLAKLLHVTPQYISRILKGEVNLSVSAAIKYGELIGRELIIINNNKSANTNTVKIQKNISRNQILNISIKANKNTRRISLYEKKSFCYES